MRLVAMRPFSQPSVTESLRAGVGLSNLVQAAVGQPEGAVA
jgi:hypothetical protein